MEMPPEPGYAAYPRAGDARNFYYAPPPMRVRIDVVLEAWNLVRKDFGNWIVGIIVVGLVPTICTLPFLFYTMSVATTNIQAMNRPTPLLLAIEIPTYLVAGIATALVVAGLQRMGLKKVRGEYAAVGDMFNLEGMFWQVALFGVFQSLVQSVIPQVISSIVIRPGMSTGSGFDQLGPMFGVFGVSLFFIVCFALFFFIVPLIIVDQKMGAIEAMGLSARTLAPFAPITFVTLLAAYIFSALGLIACCAGVLFTAPVQYAIGALIYHDFYRPMPPQMQPVYTPPGPEFKI